MKPNFSLLKTHLLADFPSGSSIAFWNEHLYLVGDDATHVLVLNTDYQNVKTIHLFDHPDKRIPKIDKTDFEAATVLAVQGADHLLLVGSAATEKRKQICLIPLQQSLMQQAIQQSATYPIATFMQRLQAKEIPELNVEGVCAIGSHLLLGNRGNLTYPTNHLIVTDLNFWEQQENAPIQLIKLVLPDTALEHTLGLSELCYIHKLDVLLITLTSEETSNAYDDGAIGDSYLGWVENARHQLQQTSIAVSQMVNLSEINEDFQTNKIEGICVESISPTQALLHLIADNDAGDSRLFALKWEFA